MDDLQEGGGHEGMGKGKQQPSLNAGHDDESGGSGGFTGGGGRKQHLHLPVGQTSWVSTPLMTLLFFVFSLARASHRPPLSFFFIFCLTSRDYMHA